MRSRLPSWIYTGLILAAVAGTQPGCKSGWKMPGSDMFSWTRKPSESTLSGTSPSISMPSASTAMSGSKSSSPPSATLPQSPALRSTPSAVNSTAANPPSATRPYGQPAPGPYGQPGAGPYGQTAPGNAMASQQLPAAGAAATANGYSTGNYATNQARPAPAGQPNPYGPPATGYPQNAPQGLVASGNPYPTTPYPSSPYPSAGNMPSQNSVVANPVPAMPSSLPPNPYGMAPPAGPNVAQSNVPQQAGYVPSGVSTVPATTASFGVPNLPPSLPPQSSMPNAYGGATPSSVAPATPQKYAGATPYQPGSIARPTTYDFSNQGPGAVPPASGSTYPRTANELPSSINR